MKATAEQIIYFSGLFDGEGCITISSKLHDGRQHHQLLVRMALTISGPIFELAALFGGNIGEYPEKAGCRHVWYWQATAKEAQAFLEAILPYVQIKYEQAVLGLLFLDTFAATKQGTPLKKEVIEIRNFLKKECQELKKVNE